MSDYQLGKDVADIQQQLRVLREEVERINTVINGKECGECVEFTDDYEENDEQKEGFVANKVFHLRRRIHDEECWCEVATVTYYKDGRYELRSTQRNSSSIADPQGGDDHELLVEAQDRYVPRAQQLIAGFEAKRFVAGGKKKPLDKSGSDSEIAAKFDRINRVTFTINCA